MNRAFLICRHRKEHNRDRIISLTPLRIVAGRDYFDRRADLLATAGRSGAPIKTVED